MTLLIGSLTIGLILSLLAFGVYISFRIFNFADITADGSFTLGAAVAAVLLTATWPTAVPVGMQPLLATLIAAIAGLAAGAVTGILHTRFKIHGLLSGILVMTALYSVNLRVMGRSNIPLMGAANLPEQAGAIGQRLAGNARSVELLGWIIPVKDLAVLGGALAMALLTGFLLYLFFRTNLGTAMRATGDNDQMMRAQGAHTGNMLIVGLALSNGFIAGSGALLAQYQGFADVQMGIGMVVWGLASVIIGRALVGSTHLGLTIAGSLMGAVLFRLLVAVALRLGLNPNDLKLVTAIFVFVALILPLIADKLRQTAARMSRGKELPHA